MWTRGTLSVLKKIKDKSNIDYIYYHLFWDTLLSIPYNHNNFQKNYIIYILKSDMSRFFDYYKSISHEIITDVFFDSVNISQSQYDILFSLVFKNLFWIKLQNISVPTEQYDAFIYFLEKNSRDINRVFLQNLSLQEDFFGKFSLLQGFWNLTFLSLDHNPLWDEWLKSAVWFLNTNNISLEYLSLVSTNIVWLWALKESLEKHRLRIIDLSDNSLCTWELRLLITENAYLEELFLYNISFTDEELYEFLDILSENQRLRHVKITLYAYQRSIGELLVKSHPQIYFDISYFEKIHFIESTTFYIKDAQSIDETLWAFLETPYFKIYSWNIEDFYLRYDDVLRNAINLFFLIYMIMISLVFLLGNTLVTIYT